jgi:hypothetical protein
MSRGFFRRLADEIACVSRMPRREAGPAFWQNNLGFHE